MLLLVISVAAFTVTLVGGLFALYLKDRLHLILGFSAGAVLGVTFFELIPESLNLTSETFSYSFINTVMALGFISYMLFDRFLGFHYSNDHHQLKNIIVAKSSLGAGSLSLHSFIDGIAIGLAFQVSGALGIIVSTAVLMHDFSDGINTVNYVLKSHGPKKLAVRWLLIDAIAPVLGIVSTLFFTLSATTLGLILALFTGFFLYIGASDLLPESQHNHPQILTTVMTIVGMGVIYGAVRLAGV